jgi:hypothetical protein
MGNAKGWTIAALILIAEIVGVWMALGLDDTSPPTSLSRDPVTLEAIRLPVDPRGVVPHDQPGDAGPLIRRAVAAYLADAGRYETFQRDRSRDAIADLAVLEPLLAATRLVDGRLYADSPEAVVVYGESTVVTALERVGKVAITAGLILEKREPERARALYEAAFSLGSRLVDERLTYRQFAVGIELMSTAGACLAEQARKANREADASLIQRFTDGQRTFVAQRVLPVFEAIYTMNAQKIATHAGDVFALATGSPDRMWRVEAVLKLGRMRYNVGNPGRPGDQRHAERVLKTLATTEPDAAVRHAATLARDLSVEQFRMLR